MSKRPVRKSAGKSVPSEPSPVPAFLVACVLIGLFTYRLTVPAHEGALLPELVLTMVFDAAMVVGLVAMRARLAAPIFWLARKKFVGSYLVFRAASRE